VNVPVVAADHTFGVFTSCIYARTATWHIPAFANTSEASNVNVLPDNEIRELHGPVTLILYFIVHVVSPAAVVALNYAVY
jgi:hypothetical protein